MRLWCRELHRGTMNRERFYAVYYGTGGSGAGGAGDMLLIFGFIVLTIVVLSGFGAALSGGRETSDRSFFDLAILGLLLVLAIGLIANFFLPLRLYLVIATAVFGVQLLRATPQVALGLPGTTPGRHAGRPRRHSGDG